MKKLASLSIAAAILAMTAGCSMLPQAAPTPTVTVTASASPSASAPESAAATESDASPSADAAAQSKTMWDYQEGVYADQVFYDVVRKGTTTLTGYSDDDLAVMAQTTCAAIANGETGRDVILKQAAMAAPRQDGELTKEMGKDVGYMLGAGAQNYCPDLLDKLVAQVNS